MQEKQLDRHAEEQKKAKKLAKLEKDKIRSKENMLKRAVNAVVEQMDTKNTTTE